MAYEAETFDMDESGQEVTQETSDWGPYFGIGGII